MMLIGLPVADTIGLYRVWSRWRATFAGDLRGRLVLCFFKADFWHSLEQKKILSYIDKLDKIFYEKISFLTN